MFLLWLHAAPLNRRPRRLNRPRLNGPSPMIDYYFDVFLQEERGVKISEYVKEIERYNQLLAEHGDRAERAFFAAVEKKHPEFRALYRKSKAEKTEQPLDLLQFLWDEIGV